MDTSRAAYSLGQEAISTLNSSSVLIVGLDGVGAEAAKNLLLAGCGSLTLVDATVASLADLATHAFLEPADVGAPRAQRCRDALAALCPSSSVVALATASSALDAAALGAFGAVVVAGGTPLAEQLRLDAACRAAGVPFVAADVRGLAAQVFVDCGAAFTVVDSDGEPSIQHRVASISSAAAGSVLVAEGGHHGLADGDWVAFSEVEGMVELNGSAPRAVRVVGPFGFEIEDTTAYSAFADGGKGYFVQVKQPTTVAHAALAAALDAPLFAGGESDDAATIAQQQLLHAAFKALHAFAAAHGGAAPSPSAAGEIDELVASAGTGASFDEGALRAFARTARGGVAPLAALVGGVAAHEAIKALTHIGTPLAQFRYFDALDCASEADDGDLAPEGNRYDGQVMALGRATVARLQAMRTLLVGAGACGSETLKSWALMGVGRIAIADGGVVRPHNLAGQCLYRAADVGAPKASTAARALAAMNPGVSIDAHDAHALSATEAAPFDDALWGSLDAVCAAVDTVEGRLYLDQRCMYFQKPLLVLGKEGTKGSTQAVLPFVSNSYGATRDAPTPSYMICTLQNFPSKIEHTMAWTIEQFGARFDGDIASLAAFVDAEADEAFIATVEAGGLLEVLRRIKGLIAMVPSGGWLDCIAWGCETFHEMFNCRIKQLLHNFPSDQLTSDGAMFWSGKKRCPAPLDFDAADPTHIAFVVAVAQLRAANFGLDVAAAMGDDAATQSAIVAAAAKLAPFVPKDGVKIAATDAEAKKMADAEAEKPKEWDTDAMARAAIAALPSREALRKTLGEVSSGLAPTAFDGSAAATAHGDFVTACANLRARNYGIVEVDAFTAWRIAAKVIPSLITTAAATAALGCLELVRLATHGRKGESDGLYRGLDPARFRSSWVNLALPLFAAAAPVPCDTVTHRTWTWSTWDRIELPSPMTLKALVEYFEETYGVEVEMVSSGVCILYTFYQPRKKVEARMPME